ncbi:MAG: DNA polymerase II large subunit, partial [Candidatus Diapherotrites archaeon]|nr:DNA polymerase II large subunit [Candidatus Diapherotrites archaeon]
MPKRVKGVTKLWGEKRVPEPLEKGLLRAKHDIFIFKDGTSRYEMLNLPLTHVKPKELKLSVEKMRELGYTEDASGRSLEDDEQIVELFPQDMLIADDGADHFIRLSKYLDDLLVKCYGLKPYYNIKKKEDLIGHVIASLAPHTAAAVAGRILGFTRGRCNFAHPYYQVAKRRNCDGEQDSTTLLFDILLNFSKQYLPSHRGGMQDAPLVVTTILELAEVDDEVYEMETVSTYPLDLYEKAAELKAPYAVKMPIVNDMVGSEGQFEGLIYTHPVSQFDMGPMRSSYTSLKTMSEKVDAQMDLQNSIDAVDEVDAAEKVLTSHFVRDIQGNMRAFARQTFRCPKCNTIYRRPTLDGKCWKCPGDHLILTISRGTVEKYIKLSQGLIEKYKFSTYMN